MNGAAETAPFDFCYLTTTGRVTGTPHRIEIWFAVHDDTVYLMAGDRDRSDWVRNLIAIPEVVLEIGGRERTSTARVVAPDTEEDALARRLLLAKYGSGGTDLASWGRTALPVAIGWPREPDRHLV